MQKDGNFVTYKDGVAVWSAQTEGRGECVSFHHDGNLVIYNSDGKAIWASNTGGKVGAWLAVQNDGNVVIYTRDGHVLWASGGS
ncbi:hypothetical protein [Streptomyces antibioticus]|uniref:hypothetical protein n=1 Tax=Streptomyces antibioticus TaxID=1890 RepID=UPI0034011ADD